jgi:SAM-dependent methyltransferase
MESRDLPTVLSKVADALRPGGRFLVSIPRGEGAGWEAGESGSPYYRALRTKEQFIDELSAARLEPCRIAGTEKSRKCQRAYGSSTPRGVSRN